MRGCCLELLSMESLLSISCFYSYCPPAVSVSIRNNDVVNGTEFLLLRVAALEAAPGVVQDSGYGSGLSLSLYNTSYQYVYKMIQICLGLCFLWITERESIEGKCLYGICAVFFSPVESVKILESAFWHDNTTINHSYILTKSLQELI